VSANWESIVQETYPLDTKISLDGWKKAIHYVPGCSARDEGKLDTEADEHAKYKY
jgi:hypothetical protein